MQGLILRCLVCDYELTGSPGEVCPECGVAIDAITLEAAQRRTPLIARRAVFRRRTWIVWWTIITVCAIGAGVFAEGAPLVGVAAFLALALGVFTTVGMGFVWSKHATGSLAPLLFDQWLRFLWVLHAPWLIVPVWAAFLTALGICILATGGDVTGLFIATSIGGVIWLTACVGAMFVWLGLWSERLEYLHIPSEATPAGAGILAFIIAPVCMCVGAAGGALALGGVLRLFGFDVGP